MTSKASSATLRPRAAGPSKTWQQCSTVSMRARLRAHPQTNPCLAVLSQGRMAASCCPGAMHELYSYVEFTRSVAYPTDKYFLPELILKLAAILFHTAPPPLLHHCHRHQSRRVKPTFTTLGPGHRRQQCLAGLPVSFYGGKLHPPAMPALKLHLPAILAFQPHLPTNQQTPHYHTTACQGGRPHRQRCYSTSAANVLRKHTSAVLLEY